MLVIRLEIEQGMRLPRGLSVSFPHSRKNTELGQRRWTSVEKRVEQFLGAPELPELGSQGIKVGFLTACSAVCKQGMVGGKLSLTQLV